MIRTSGGQGVALNEKVNWQKDLGEPAFSSDGRFVYCGRGDDMLKVSGKWVSPQEVENCLLEHPGVREVSVVGVTVLAISTARAWSRMVNGIPA